MAHALKTLAVFFLFAPGTTWACTVCFGNPDSLQAKGLVGAVVFLLTTVGVLLYFFGRFFRRLKRLEAEQQQNNDNDNVGGSRTAC